MIDPTVRPGVPADTAQLRWLEHESREALVGARGAARWLETNPELDLGWDDAVAAGNVVVAHIDEVLVGYIRVEVDGDVATVADVYVLAEARELGFGDELIAASLAIARARGARVLEGSALPGDRLTKNLYERAGIKARLITVSVELDD